MTEKNTLDNSAKIIDKELTNSNNALGNKILNKDINDKYRNPPPAFASIKENVGEHKKLNKQEKNNRDWQLKAKQSNIHNDPLLGCLSIICMLLDRPISADALTSGLPLEDAFLTPDLYIQASKRADITSKMMKYKLDDISNFMLPCVILLKNKRAIVITKINEQNNIEVILPEMGAGSTTIKFNEINDEYIGYTFFSSPQFCYDKRAENRKVEDPKGWFWGTIFSSWKLYIEVLIAAMMINIFAIASPLFVMNVYDRVVPNNAIETLWVLAIGITLVLSFDFLLKLLRGYLVDMAGKTADTRIASRLFQQMLGMKMAHRPASAGGLANTLREFESLREFFTSTTITSLVDLPFIFLFLIVIKIISGSWLMALVPFTMVFLVVIMGSIIQMPMRRMIQETQKEAQQKHAILIEAISGIETIKATASEGKMQRAWEIFVNKTANSSMKATRWSQISTNFSGFAMQMVTVGVVIVGVYLIQEGEMTVGALIASTILSGRALAPLGQIAGIATKFNQARESLIQLDHMMQTPVERPVGRSFVNRSNFSGHIEFKNVSFTYSGAKTQALNGVSFDIKAGEKVAIVGRIGSGKSTLERLILGLQEPDEGSILIDGTDTRQLDPADLRRNCGVVPQDIYLFFGSIRENIALAAPYIDENNITHAAQIAGVFEFTSKNPMGLDLEVGERGMNLSGGQRQSVAVARALLLDPPILIFDEPTSAMDNTTELRLKARLKSISDDKTMILITHRESMLSLVDRLIVMDNGRVVADGPKETVIQALASGQIQTAKI